jgi:tetratricopeptide (TPR) repeat protein
MKRIFTKLALVSAVLVLIALIGTGCSAKARLSQHLLHAQKYLEAGEYDRAEIEFLNVLRLDPANSAAVGSLGIVYFDQGRFGIAVPYLLRGREVSPDNLAVRIRLAAALLSAGKSKDARTESDFVLQKKPSDTEAPLVYVQTVTTKVGDVDVVRQRLTTLLQVAPGNASLQVALGSLDLRLRRMKEAREHFDQALSLDANSSAAYAALGALAVAEGDLPRAEEAFSKSSELAPERSPRRLLYARFKIQTQNLAVARVSLERIVKNTPDFLPAGTMLAEIFLADKKPEQAANLLNRLLARDPANLEILVLSSRAFIALGQVEKATGTMEKARNLYPQSTQALYHYALTLLAQTRTREASASLTQALALDPEFTDASVLLAGINQLRNDFPAAIFILKQILQKHPQLLRAQSMLADTYRGHGDLAEALRLYEDLEPKFSTNPELPLARGLVLARLGRLAEARNAFNRVLELSPASFPAAEQLVNLDLADKKYDDAGQLSQQLALSRPASPEPQLFLARIALAQSDAVTAAASLEKALVLQPDFRPAYLLAARVYSEGHELDKALQHLRKLVELNPRDITALMTIGTLCEEQKQFAAARDTYEKLLAIEPRFTPALNNLAYLYSEKFGELGRATELARKALDLKPDDSQIADTLGWILYKKGEYTRALPLLQKSAAKSPEDAEMQFHLGMVNYMIADEEAARVALQRALGSKAVFPGDEEARQALEMLLLPSDLNSRTVIDKRLAANPGDPVATLRLARFYEQHGDQSGAQNSYQSLVTKNPQNVSALLGLARLLQTRAADQPKAFELARTAYKFAPDDPAVITTLGQLAYSTGDYNWATSLLRSAAAKQEGDASVLFDLALAEFYAGEVDVAAATLHKVLQSPAPSFARADDARQFQDLLAIEAEPDQSTLSSAKIEAALKARPGYLPALAAKTALAERSGDVKTATALCEDILKRYPSFTPAIRRLAVLVAASGSDDRRAMSLLYKARESFPTAPEVARALGLVAFRLGDWSRSVIYLKERSIQSPDDPEVLYCLGLAQARIKDSVTARQSLLRALSLEPKNAHADEAQRTLEQLK